MKKYILTILLIACILSIPGCSNKEINDSTQNEQNETETNIEDDIITYNGKKYKKSELSSKTLKWLELPEEDRAISSYYPPEFATITDKEGINEAEANITTVGTPIKEQCFNVTLDEWGAVTFAPYAPENNSFQPEGLNPDVRFYLIDGDNALYEFPGWNEEHTNADLFVAVSAIAFKDYNDDGLLDVITICEYETMSGEGFQIARIYFQLEGRQGFEEDTLLTEYLSNNHKTDSIAAIMDAKEGYLEYFKSRNGQYGTYDQLIVMAENKDMWTENWKDMGESCHYAVADLDRNGRYEIIISGIGGTGRYSYNRVFEINENYDGLVECTTEFVDEGSEPDISISEKWTTYMDDNGEFHYIVYDWVRNGISESCQSVMELTLQNGKIMTKLIADKITIFSDDTSTVTCTDSEGNAITEEEYENAAKKYFAGCQERTTCFGWQDVKELGNAAEEIVTQLDTSLNIFLYHEP